MAYTIDRLYAKKGAKDGSTEGFRVGSCSLFVSDDNVWAIDGIVLPRNSVEYLLYFSLQSLQDTYGKADMEEIDAKKAWGDKLAALKDGTIGTRGGGEGGVSEETSVARSIIRAKFKAKHGKGEAWARFKLADAKGQAKILDDLWEKNGEKFADELALELKRRKELRAVAAAADELEI